MEENTTVATAEVVDQVVEKLIEDKGLANLKEEQKKELEKVLKEQLVKRINLEIVEELPDDKFEGLKKAAKEKNVDYEKLQDVVAEADLDMEKILEKVVPEFRQKFLDMELKEKAEA
ncbi:hypothetical protein IJH02_01950 [Candidatus Saccharibacteria bacterium]|nr:hypothetical protein [Candidatus Saccharibacteria bacterium]